MVITHISRQMAKEFTWSKPYIVISITDPGTKQAALAVSANLRAVLRLKFHDLDKDIGPHIPLVNRAPILAVYFNEVTAKKIVDFVREHMDHIEAIVVHCEAGISRSNGVASALSKILNNDDTYFKGRPNMLVYRKVLEAWYGNVDYQSIFQG